MGHLMAQLCHKAEQAPVGGDAPRVNKTRGEDSTCGRFAEKTTSACLRVDYSGFANEIYARERRGCSELFAGMALE